MSAEFLFGVDGGGKSTIARQRKAADPEVVVLSGTNLASWRGAYPELVAEGLITGDVPPDSEFLEKADYTNATVLGIMATGRSVVVDGPALHKTVVNTAAGLTLLPGYPAAPSVLSLMHGPIGDRFAQLWVPGVTHTHVTLPQEILDDDPSGELQRRLSERPGGHSSWDPQNRMESLAQLNAASELAVILDRWHHRVQTAVSEL